MVLAIGSTTYCSVSLADETETVRLYNKAMTYFETAMGCSDLVSRYPGIFGGVVLPYLRPGRIRNINASSFLLIF